MEGERPSLMQVEDILTVKNLTIVNYSPLS